IGSIAGAATRVAITLPSPAYTFRTSSAIHPRGDLYRHVCPTAAHKVRRPSAALTLPRNVRMIWVYRCPDLPGCDPSGGRHLNTGRGGLPYIGSWLSKGR